MRVIIAAGGESERWNNYRNTPKHLVEIEGQVLLNRTIKQFKKYTNDIILIAKDDRYIFKDIVVEKPLYGEWYDFGKLYSSNHLWSNNRTIIVFGDVYFTDEAVKKIVSNKDSYKFFIRRTGSKLTGKKNAEIFGIAFSSDMNSTIKTNIEHLINKAQIGPGTWQLYFYMHGINHIRQIGRQTKNSGHIEINDWTDDFDYPQDLIKWERMRLKFGAQ